MAGSGLLLVLLGPHASGKSTIGKLLAACHGWRYDEELGEVARRRGEHAAVDCRAPQDGFDAAVAASEDARDDDAVKNGTCLQRVVETWHPGNLAWAQMRASPAALASLRAAAAAAVGRATSSHPAPLLLVQPLCAGAEAVALRRAAGAAARVPAADAGGDDEAALLAHTARVAQLATQHATELGLRMLPPVSTDFGDAGAAADAVFAHVLEAAHPPRCLVPNLYNSLSHAASVLRAAASLDARLRAPEPAAFLRAVAALEASTNAGSLLPLAAGRAVVIEGLDGTGKSTLVAALTTALGAHAARTPPQSIATLRPLFDEMPQPVSRAFYMCCNYVAAAELAQLATDGRPTVVDRYYHSTAAYTLAAASPRDALGAPAFAWPADLPPPALVLLLRVDDAARVRRLHARGAAGWGATEVAQQADPGLARRIDDAFVRVAPPAGCRVQVLDAAASPEALCAAALAACAQAGL